MAQAERKKILIIDDEKDILSSLSAFLRRNNYGVWTADNGREGLRLVKEQMPSLLILDLMLPDVDGSDVAAQLLQDPLTKHIPIIFLTSMVSKLEQEELGMFVGNRCIVAKPCKVEEILGLVKSRIGEAL